MLQCRVEAKHKHKLEVEEHFHSDPRGMWQGIQAITDDKHSNFSPAQMNMSFIDELNDFYCTLVSTRTTWNRLQKPNGALLHWQWQRQPGRRAAIHFQCPLAMRGVWGDSGDKWCKVREYQWRKSQLDANEKPGNCELIWILKAKEIWWRGQKDRRDDATF